MEIQGSAPLFEVFDMPTSIAFYRDVIGFRVVSTNVEPDTDPADVEWTLLRLNDVELIEFLRTSGRG